MFSKQAIAILPAPDNVLSPETLKQQINQDPGNQRNGNQNDGQNDSNGSEDRPSKTVEAALADNDAVEYEEYYSYEEGHVAGHQETPGKLDKLGLNAKDFPSPAETQYGDRISFEGPINPQNSTIDEMVKVLQYFSNQELIVADNGTRFTSTHFRQFWKENGIAQKFSPNHPQSNGRAERFVDTVKRGLLQVGGRKTSGKTIPPSLKMHQNSPNIIARRMQVWKENQDYLR
ncbi:hypothetical protein X801_04328 [Opisthorchis viverrini]|uniref:Integrase catalytic domain-containing protein n=1 Tax=Opisthorchis viverrini TaxID=6198 RepID=A0A1S8WZD8_OPIVI|nr:hypothetical protein X801_04328 [Opisthorchis viverrini]